MFLAYITKCLEDFANEKNKYGSDRHPATLKDLVNELRVKINNELIPIVKLDLELFEKWQKCR
jgi:hypothetical protein